MAGLDRESIYAALLAQLAALVTGLVSAPSRRYRDPLEEVSSTEQPALFIVVDRETPTYRPNHPLEWTLRGWIFVYARTDNTAAAPSTPLAQLVQQVEGALQWQPGDGGMPPQTGMATTLGKKCVHVTLGEVVYEEATKTGQGEAVIPFEILAVTT